MAFMCLYITGNSHGPQNIFERERGYHGLSDDVQGPGVQGVEPLEASYGAECFQYSFLNVKANNQQLFYHLTDCSDSRNCQTILLFQDFFFSFSMS